MTLLVALHFITVHGPNDQEIQINIAEISSIRQPQKDTGAHFAKGTNCIIVMNNGKFISTAETCLEVVNRITTIDEQEE